MEIDEILASEPTPPAETESALAKAGLDRDSFLRIFLAQLQHQDPFDPQSSSELGSQLAQFSQLEQSLLMTGELRGVNARLDELIAGSNSAGRFNLDPLATLGREVEIEGNHLLLSEAGASQSLRIEIDQESNGILIQVEDGLDSPLGLAELVTSDDNGNRLTLQRGSYELSFQDGLPMLRSPSGEEIPLTFLRLVPDSTGRLVPDETDPIVFPPPAGTSYRFSIIANSRVTGPFEPQTHTTGRVDSIRLIEGRPVLSIAGQEIDFSLITRIHQ